MRPQVKRYELKIQPLEPIENQNYTKEYLELEKNINVFNGKEEIYYIIENNDILIEEKYNLSEMKKLSNFYHNFRGMNCYKYNHLRIKPNGFIVNRCCNNNSIDNIFLMKDIEKFKEKINKSYICKENYCSNRDDIRFIKKFKNEDN